MPYDPNGIKITMPYVATMQIKVVMEGVNEVQVRAAMLRAVSINSGLVLSPMEIGVDVQKAPPEMVKQLAEQLHGRKV